MASGVSGTRGGLSRAVEALGRSSFSAEKGGLACPRPRPAPVRDWTSEGRVEAERSSTSSAVAASLAAGRDDPALVEAGLAELRRLFAAECSLGTSAPGFSVSPPVRSGAANGLVHDSLWRQEAPVAVNCKASLRALHERAGPRCLSSCAGDYRLLMASPDQGVHLLAGAVEEEEGSNGGSLGWDPEATAPAAAYSAARSMASSRSSPAPAAGWRPAHCASPEPDLFGF